VAEAEALPRMPQPKCEREEFVEHLRRQRVVKVLALHIIVRFGRQKERITDRT